MRMNIKIVLLNVNVYYVQNQTRSPKTLLYLKLQLHAGDMFSTLHLGQLLHVRVQTPGGHLSVPTGYGLQQCLVDEAVLVLRLHHVVPL